MDFYDSLLQYDFDYQNKLTNRLNAFLKCINTLKNNTSLNTKNNKNIKYKNILNLIDEINSSTKFKNKIFSNQKKHLILRMNTKKKVNSKFYIYAKDMSQIDQKIDIIKVEDNFGKKEKSIELTSSNNKDDKQHENIFNQRQINHSDSGSQILSDIAKSDINKIICDIIKQNVKIMYKKKINEIHLSNDITFKNSHDSNSINCVKNNNYIKIDIQNKEKDIIGKKIQNNNNISIENSSSLIQYFNENKRKSIKKKLTNNGSNSNIKSYNNDLKSSKNLNENNFVNNKKDNNIMHINKKIQSAKNDNILHHRKKLGYENDLQQNEEYLNNSENEESLENSLKNHNYIIKNYANENPNIEGHKKMIIRNIQQIQIKNIKLRNNQTGYNLTNICQKKLSGQENPKKSNSKKNNLKNRQCVSPGDIGLDKKKINIIKFKLGKNNNESPEKKNTRINLKKNNEKEKSMGDEQKKIQISKLKDEQDNKDHQMLKFNSIKKIMIQNKVNNENNNNDISEIYPNDRGNSNNNNILIRNYKTNLNRNQENENGQIVNQYNIKKSNSKESGSNSYIPWNFDNSHMFINKSNYKGNFKDSLLNHILQREKKINFENNLKNINEYHKINNNNNRIHLNNIQKYDIEIMNNKKNNKNNNDSNLAERRQLGYHETINIRKEQLNHNEGTKVKGKKRILSTRVHIRGINSSKNFNIL